MKHIKNAKVTAKIQIREGAQIRVLGGTTRGGGDIIIDAAAIIIIIIIY